MPFVNGYFNLDNLKLYVCFRPYLKEFLLGCKKYFEVIVWTSSQQNYSYQLLNMIDQTLGIKFDHCLSLGDQMCSEDKHFYVKNIEILIGQGKRQKENIIFLDTDMESFTFSLTNGIYIPHFKIGDYYSDITLKTLLKYLGQFVDPIFDVQDVRIKIKNDFNMLEMFNSFKQT